MLLRSSSTPVLGSLLSSSSLHFSSDSPGHHPPPHPHPLPHPLHPVSFHFSAASDSSDRDPSALGVRRTCSDGNLTSLLGADPHSDDHHHHHHPSLKCSSSRRTNPTLEPIPSFSIYSPDRLEDEEEEDEGGTPKVAIFGQDLGFVPQENQSVVFNENPRGAPPLFLARGLGIDRVGSGLFDAGGAGGKGGGRGSCSVATGNGGEQSDIEIYYRNMIEEDPINALFLSNYAQFLYQVKGDVQRAEEYYSRAILADPSDGEILSQYAKLIWELHRDQERASSYFEQAMQACPHNSHVLAAYAGFLWETDGDDDGTEDDGSGVARDYVGSFVRHGPLASATN